MSIFEVVIYEQKYFEHNKLIKDFRVFGKLRKTKELRHKFSLSRKFSRGKDVIHESWNSPVKLIT